MRKINLQLFAEAVQGKKLIYLFRVLEAAATNEAMALAFVTENERSKSKDSETTVTKDGAIRTPGASETEITATALLAKGDTVADTLEDAMDNDKIVECWEVNLDEPGKDTGKFKARYFQGYLSEFTLTSSAEEHAEYSITYGANGAGAKGEATVSAKQQEIAAYVFADTQKAANTQSTGA